MATANAVRALGPVWFRFTEEDDRRIYGDRWYKYDESAILRLPARDLIALETDLGMPLVAVMNGFRESTALGDTAAAWMGVRSADPMRAGDFDEFNPLTMTIEWSKTDPEPGPKDEGPESMLARPESDSPTDSTSDSMTLAPTATVALPVMPVAGF